MSIALHATERSAAKNFFFAQCRGAIYWRNRDAVFLQWRVLSFGGGDGVGAMSVGCTPLSWRRRGDQLFEVINVTGRDFHEFGSESGKDREVHCQLSKFFVVDSNIK